MTPEAELALADRHIAEADARILRQHRLVERLAAAGHDTGLAETLLETLQRSLAALQAHRRVIQAEIAGKLPG
jgi:hypothetical protein